MVHFPRPSGTLSLALLVLLFFAPLLIHPGQILDSVASDLIGLHIPQARFLVGSWRETGELPRWCPHRFAGSPFLHDIQVGAFYPPNWVLFLSDDEAIGPTMSWLVVAHVYLAGVGMLAYARTRGLGRGGSWVAALGFMFGGKWMLHILGAGHYMAMGLAWLPMVLLVTEAALRQRSPMLATWAGALFALLALGTHPQWTLYSALFLAAWTLGGMPRWEGGIGTDPSQASSGNVRAGLVWIGLGTLGALVSLGVLAAQGLPALEAAGQATRDAEGTAALAPDHPLMTLFSLVGPPTALLKSFEDWEYRSGFGVLWVAAALAGAWGARGRVRWEAGVTLAMFAFALGGSRLVSDLPGFRLFALPSRMILLTLLPVSLFAGRATDALFGPEAPAVLPQHRGVRRLLVAALLAALVGFGGLAWLNGARSVRGHPYWVALLILVPAAWWTLSHPGAPGSTARRRALGIWGVLLLLDLWAIAGPHVRVRPGSELYAVPECVRALTPPGRVLDRHLSGRPTRTPVSPPLSLIRRLEPIRGYNPMDIYRYRLYLRRIAGKDDGTPVPAYRQVLNFPIRNRSLLNLLGVRYLVQPADPEGQPVDPVPIADDPRWRKLLTDPRPAPFNIFAGNQPLPPYTVFENLDVFPRAFVVPQIALPPPPSQLFQAMAATDFRHIAYFDPPPPGPASGSPLGTFRPATITDDRPNRVTVVAETTTPGALVLADPWFPGWSASLDGHPVPLHRADDLFRGVVLPAGRHTITFRFDPPSFLIGRVISLATLGAVLLGTALVVGRSSSHPFVASSRPHVPTFGSRSG